MSRAGLYSDACMPALSSLLLLLTGLTLAGAAHALDQTPEVRPFRAAVSAPPAILAASSGLSLLRDFSAVEFDGYIPPNPTLAAGPNHILAITNGTVSLFDKTGGLAAQSTLFEFFTPVIQPGDFLTDPRALFDAGRFWVTVASRRANPFAAYFLLAVSKTSDPNEDWSFYALDAATDNGTPTTHFADLPSIGSDDNSIYLTANMFDSTDFSFRGAKIRVLAKQPLLAGMQPTYFDFSDLQNLNGRVFHLLAAQSLEPSSAGFILNSHFPASCHLTLWRVANLPGSPAFLAKVTLAVGGDCGAPPNASQPGTSTRIETGGPRLINAVARGGYVWAAVAVAHDWGSGAVATARVFQIDVRAFPNVVVTQDFLHGYDGVDVYYPVVAVAPSGDVLLGFNQSSQGQYVSIGYAAQSATDPRNSLSSTGLLKEGSDSYVRLDSANRNRWGDYNAACVDPVSNTFWLMGEYAASPANRWGTWIGELSFPPPTPTRTPTPTRSGTPTHTPTHTPTATASPTFTRSPSPSQTPPPSPTPTNSPTQTATRTLTLTRTPTQTRTASSTATTSATPTHTETATPTQTRQPTLTPTQTRTPSPSSTPTITRTRTPSLTPSWTPTLTRTRTATHSPTVTPTETGPTRTPTLTPTTTATPTHTTSPTVTPTASITPTLTTTFTPTESPTATSTPTDTATPTTSPTPTLTATFPPSRTPRPSLTPTSTSSPTVTETATISPTPSPSDSPTATPTASSTATDSPTATPTDTDTPSPTATETPSASATSTHTPTSTPTDTSTATPTQTATDTPTSTPSPTDSPTITPTHTPTPRPLVGDLDWNGSIDERDLRLLAGNLFAPLPIAEADLNLDARVNVADVVAFVIQ